MVSNNKHHNTRLKVCRSSQIEGNTVQKEKGMQMMYCEQGTMQKNDVQKVGVRTGVKSIFLCADIKKMPKKSVYEGG